MKRVVEFQENELYDVDKLFPKDMQPADGYLLEYQVTCTKDFSYTEKVGVFTTFADLIVALESVAVDKWPNFDNVGSDLDLLEVDERGDMLCLYDIDRNVSASLHISGLKTPEEFAAARLALGVDASASKRLKCDE